MNKDIKIIIATHKIYDMPNSELYLPVQAGAVGKSDLGYTRDDTGDNISNKNPLYSELTALYWAYKNLKNDYIGLVHYRRYFSLNKKSVLTYEEANFLLEETDVILPKKRHYYIETLYNHYKHTMYIEPLDETRKVIEKLYPNYLKEFDLLKKRRSAHMFNMFIMKREILDEYLNWLFSILEELEKRIDVSIYDSFHSRFFGRISELLLDVYIRTNNIKYKEVSVLYTEKISYLKKIISFLKAKFLGVKYNKSF